jgi:hypothetical protein
LELSYLRNNLVMFCLWQGAELARSLLGASEQTVEIDGRKPIVALDRVGIEI